MRLTEGLPDSLVSGFVPFRQGCGSDFPLRYIAEDDVSPRDVVSVRTFRQSLRREGYVYPPGKYRKIQKDAICTKRYTIFIINFYLVEVNYSSRWLNMDLKFHIYYTIHSCVASALLRNLFCLLNYYIVVLLATPRSMAGEL